MTIYDWPATLTPQGANFNPRGMSVSGPVSVTGRSQAASIDAGYWIASYSAIKATDPADEYLRVRILRALRGLLEGGANHIRAPTFDWLHAPWPLNGDDQVTSVDPVTFSDDALFSDGTGFAQTAISALVVGDTAARSTSIVIDFLQAGEIVGGEYFSLGDRLYVIKAVLAETGTEKTLAIWPPLREAVPDGTNANFDRPVCRMKLTDDAASDLNLDLGRFGFPDMSFVEVF